MMPTTPIQIGVVVIKAQMKNNRIWKMKKEKRAVTLYKRNAG